MVDCVGGSFSRQQVVVEGFPFGLFFFGGGGGPGSTSDDVDMGSEWVGGGGWVAL